MRPFTDKQIELVETFADQAVIAIENVRLFDEVQARTRELSRIAGAADGDRRRCCSVISSSPGELEPVFETMLAKAAHYARPSSARSTCTTESAFRAAAFHNAPPALSRHASASHGFDRRRSVLGRLAITKQVVQIADVRRCSLPRGQTNCRRHRRPCR